jgi:hypothetical protein
VVVNAEHFGDRSRRFASGLDERAYLVLSCRVQRPSNPMGCALRSPPESTHDQDAGWSLGGSAESESLGDWSYLGLVKESRSVL